MKIVSMNCTFQTCYCNRSHFSALGILHICSKCFSNGQNCINDYLYQSASLSHGKKFDFSSI